MHVVALVRADPDEVRHVAAGQVGLEVVLLGTMFRRRGCPSSSATMGLKALPALTRRGKSWTYATTGVHTAPSVGGTYRGLRTSAGHRALRRPRTSNLNPKRRELFLK
jgi:hypothetical protein